MAACEHNVHGCASCRIGLTRTGRPQEPFIETEETKDKTSASNQTLEQPIRRLQTLFALANVSIISYRLLAEGQLIALLCAILTITDELMSSPTGGRKGDDLVAQQESCKSLVLCIKEIHQGSGERIF
jgi:hypothetical protein